MATDLSKIIQDGISTTLVGLLGKDSTFKETTKVDIRDLSNNEFLQVNSEFAFDKLTTLFEFFIPAPSASVIFNTMMSADDYDIATTIDDDTSDAMSEFVSNLSGGLVTTFNAENIDDLGNVKFNIQHKEIVQGSEIQNIDTFFRFSIDIEEKNVLVFIRFQEEFLPFIPNIAESEVTFYPAEVDEEDDESEEPEEATNLETKETSTETKEEEKEELKSSEEDNESDTQEEEEKTSKLKKLLTKRNKIILGVVGGLIVILLALSIFSGSEEEEMVEEEVVKQEQPKEEKEPQKIETQSYKTLKKIDFDVNDIHVERLNKRLSTLTKYHVLSEEEIRQEEREERARLEKLQREKELLEFAKQNKEEPVIIQEEMSKETEPEQKVETPVQSQDITQIPQETVKQTVQMIDNESKQEEIKKESSSYYISSNDIKYNLYKNLVLQGEFTTARISICNDKDGRTSIFIGPFQSDVQQMKMKTLIQKENANITIDLLNITKEEFDQKCNF